MYNLKNLRVSLELRIKYFLPCLDKLVGAFLIPIVAGLMGNTVSEYWRKFHV